MTSYFVCYFFFRFFVCFFFGFAGSRRNAHHIRWLPDLFCQGTKGEVLGALCAFALRPVEPFAPNDGDRTGLESVVIEVGVVQRWP